MLYHTEQLLLLTKVRSKVSQGKQKCKDWRFKIKDHFIAAKWRAIVLSDFEVRFRLLPRDMASFVRVSTDSYVITGVKLESL